MYDYDNYTLWLIGNNEEISIRETKEKENGGIELEVTREGFQYALGSECVHCVWERVKLWRETQEADYSGKRKLILIVEHDECLLEMVFVFLHRRFYSQE